MKKHEDLNITFLMLAGFLIRFCLLILIPLYPAQERLPGYNDEPLHLNYVRYVAQGNGWPRFEATGIDSIDHLRGEFGQAPLYYALSAPAFQLGEMIQPNGGLYGARLMSIILGIMAAIYAYKAALFWSRRQSIALSALTAMLMAPNAVLFTTLVTNDALLICLSTLAIHSLLVSRSGSEGTLRHLMTGILFGAVVWAKVSGILLFPLLWFSGSIRSGHRARWRARLLTVITAVIVLSPMAWRSYHHYGETIPNTQRMQEQYQPEQAVGVSGGAILHPLMAVKLFLRSIPQPMTELWGSILEKLATIGWLLLWFPLTLYGALLALRSKPQGQIFLVSGLCVTLGFIYWQINAFQIEFRLFAPAFSSLAMLSAVGIERLKIPHWLQAIFWVCPILGLPLY